MVSRAYVRRSAIWILVCATYLTILLKWQISNGTESTREFEVRTSIGTSPRSNRNNETNVVKEGESVTEELSIYDERRRTMLKSCRQNGYHGHKLKPVGTDHFSLDRKDELVYCDIPKVASTFWKRVLQIASGKRRKQDVFDIPARSVHVGLLETFQRKGFDEIHDALSSHTKFMFVREPYSRIFSAYIDKIFTPRPAFASLRAKIKKLAGKRSGDKKKDQCALDITFTDAVRFLTQAIENGTFRDAHYVPMYDLCRPCGVQFDIIGKMETFKQDTNYIFEKSGFPNSIKLDDKKSDLDSISDIVDSTFAEKKGMETCLPFGQALKYVWKKAVIRGILSKEEKLPKRFIKSSNFTKDDFRKAMHDAYKRSFENPKRLQNRKEALKEAILSLPKDVLENYKNLYRPDFEIFGYDIENPEIFKATRPKHFYLIV